MKRAAALAIVLAASLVASGAAADRRPSLRLEREPVPRSLRIRPRAAQAPAPVAPAAPRTPMPAAPTATATDRIDTLAGVRDVLQPISFSINLGFQVDGARASGRAALGATAPTPGRDYAALRGYGFGEAFVSTRGLAIPSLSTYFAARFQVARQLEATVAPGEPPPEDRTLAPPIATWFERSGTELRTGWVEAKDFLPARWGGKNIRVRAGDQFIYGPWIVHMYGLHAAYEGPMVTLGGYTGQRRADYQRDLEDNQPGVLGGTAKLDLRGLTTKVPISFAGEYLIVESSDGTGQPKTDSAQIQVDWRPRRDIAVIAQQRWLDGELANQHVEIRARYKEVTNLVFELMRRFDADWRWDPTLVVRSDDATEARRYLDLGPVAPQLQLSARGGTLIAENLDLFGRVAFAPDTKNANDPANTFSSAYLELAGALEARVRRQIAIGTSVLWRNTQRVEPIVPIVDVPLEPQALPDPGVTGEDAFVEAGATLRMTLGARRLSALIEGYGRRTEYNATYSDPELPLLDSMVRAGGRFTVDAWVGRRVRIFASYDVSSGIDTAPELSGYKSLRLAISGVY